MSIVTNEELARPTRHIFLSPHYDDIALSCGGAAALLANLGRTPEVALIFGDHPDPAQPMTDFANHLHQQWGMSAESVIASRRAEEQVAALTLGACDRFLPFRDAIYRGARYLSDDDLFGTTHPEEEGLPDEIIDQLGLASSAGASARVYAPLAVGMHVDHQHAHTVGLRLAERGLEVWFYEDLPYGLRSRLTAARQAMLGQELHPGPAVDVSGVWSTKIDAIMAYPSQLKVIFGDYVGVGSTRSAIDEAMSAYARGLGDGRPVERFWVRG